MIIPLILGPIFLILGLRAVFSHFRLQSKPYSTVQGTVVGYKKRKVIRKKYRYSPSFAPQFEYHYNGTAYTVTHTFATNRQDWIDEHFPMGHNVELRVYEDAPHDAVLNTQFGTNVQLIGGVVFALVGAVVTVVGVVLLRM